MAWPDWEEARRVGSTVGRTMGFLVAAVVGGVLLWLLNVEPGWRAVPVVIDSGARVMPYVNAPVALGCALNVAYAAWYRWWLRCLGEILSAVVAVVVVLRIWDVFPFDVGDVWATVLRWVLAVAVAGAALSVVVNGVQLVRGPPRGDRAQTSDNSSGTTTTVAAGAGRAGTDGSS
jgi:hypothetical protein